MLEDHREGKKDLKRRINIEIIKYVPLGVHRSVAGQCASIVVVGGGSKKLWKKSHSHSIAAQLVGLLRLSLRNGCLGFICWSSYPF